MSYLGDVRLGDIRLGDVFLSDSDTSRRYPIMHMQNAASTYGDYVDFLTTYLSLVHVITPDDSVGTKNIDNNE